ncbi:MAG: pirin family protein [Candidatus Omnitrophica bacterium]|nr:pirin family protein [Candidatus Omnitrophota bacterium]MCB9720019.1 pirin family protein [Candidatus Omnitrophota bacterium]
MASAHGAKIKIRKAHDRGHADHGWLNSWHTFSFADYHDPAHMGFRSLRVINDDTVQGGQGFGTHPHRDMEIISYVIDGALEHKDSMGNGSVLRAGHIQRITAGTGISHSEFNHSATAPVHFLQIWIIPDQRGLKPSYEEFQVRSAGGGMCLVASPDGAEGSVTVHQDARLYFGRLAEDETVTHTTSVERGVWVQVVKGELTVAGQRLTAGDGMSLEQVEDIALEAGGVVDFLLFDLA